MQKLNGWTRLAVLLCMMWALFVLGATALEYLTYSGGSRFTAGFEFTVPASGKRALDHQAFWTFLIAPIVLILSITNGLVPALNWVRRGFDG